MRSQEDDGKQQRESQPDHTPEADQASQDKLGPQSVTLGLAAQPVVVSVCWCWEGRSEFRTGFQSAKYVQSIVLAT